MQPDNLSEDQYRTLNVISGTIDFLLDNDAPEDVIDLVQEAYRVCLRLFLKSSGSGDTIPSS